MTIRDMVNKYSNCAINNIPDGALELMQNCYPGICDWSYKHVPMEDILYNCRFRSGHFYSFCHAKYSVGDMFGTEFVINYEELDFESMPAFDFSVEELI